MSLTKLSLSRRHVLGDLYRRCDPVTDSIPVYVVEDETTLAGHADESLGHYADALSFHLSDNHCKKLSSGHFVCSMEFDHSDPSSIGSQSRVKLTSIILKARKPYVKPVVRPDAGIAKEAQGIIPTF